VEPKKTSKTLVAVVILMLVVLIALVMVIVLGYINPNWDWVGLGPYISKPHPQNAVFQRGKTFWDWLQLAIIPAVLVVGGYLFNYTTSRTEREIASDKQREDALQAYIDSMSELLLHEKLRESSENDEVRKIARVRTLRVLPRLNNERKRYVIQFLYESDLIHGKTSIIDLHEADLRKANLDDAQLNGASLSGTKLMKANLSGANLKETILSDANLSDANLSRADLSGAIVTCEQLKQAKSLKGATMHDGTIHA